MLSYIVAFVAFAVFLGNPIYRILFLSREQNIHSPRPQLNESLLAIPAANDSALRCPRDSYAARIYSREPLVVYLENFLSPAERTHLLEISEPLFKPSTITNDGASTHRDASIRDSQDAMVPRTDTVRCIERRARAFQGWQEDLYVERLRTQRYTPGGHYAHHYDWSSNAGGWGRVSSIMAWVAATPEKGETEGETGFEGGATEFPLLPGRGFGSAGDEGDGAADDKGAKTGVENPWCRFVECEGGRIVTGENGLGVRFKPVEGNAVFWSNFRADGSGEGYPETWHAGLPVIKGEKVGLNIWSSGKI